MTATTQPAVPDAKDIPPLSHTEAGMLAHQELERFLDLVKSLEADDWDKATDCSLWSVGQIVAHQAGAYAGFASWSQFKRQWSQLLKKPRPGQLPVDLINRCQVEDRAAVSPAELIAELEAVGPRAIATRQRLPALLRGMYLPFGPPLGFARVDYLTDLIYTRDTWSHRLDICRAVGREMKLTRDHDGRMAALVVRELATKHRRRLKEKTVIYELTGPAGGRWRLGTGIPAATIRMDALDFSLLSSGRLTPDQAKLSALIAIEGDAQVANRVLGGSSVPY